MSVSVELIAQIIERIAPKSWAEEWDNVGLLVGNGAAPVKRLLLALDGTSRSVEEAEECGAQLIVSHHPILFRGLKNLREDNREAQIALRLIRSGIAFYTAHTNLDQSVLSSSWTIANALGLRQMELLAPVAWESQLKLVVFVPATHAEVVRQALASVGVGSGISAGVTKSNYTECFFQGLGVGMFRPLQGAQPAIGRIGELTRVEEVKLESIVAETQVEKALRTLQKVHPYEEPAYDLIPLKNSGPSRGYGVVGYLPEPLKLEEIWPQIQNLFKTGSWAVPQAASQSKSDSSRQSPAYPAGTRVAGDPRKLIGKIAIVNGSGGNFIAKALFKGADLYISGDISHHQVLDALERKMAVADIGHFLSEVPMICSLADYLRTDKVLSDLEIIMSSHNRVPWSG
ncbi:MAG TPA: Nif3-like dinuclear metal center hexameric protein [Desulfitobacteriaceae bacterium]|nr:Nif3-like dinuclear metal center hexameric protein [Desulfitobacteriaceae bacterium]